MKLGHGMVFRHLLFSDTLKSWKEWQVGPICLFCFLLENRNDNMGKSVI